MRIPEMEEQVLTTEQIVKAHRERWPWMYQGNDKEWCEVQLHRLITLSETDDVKFLLVTARREVAAEIFAEIEARVCRHRLPHYCPNCDQQITGMPSFAWANFKAKYLEEEE
jgi:hypothetical protein